jgi:tripartite-type tricarboxylate transporter receptor subunit TctC
MRDDKRPVTVLVPYIIDGGTGKRSRLLGRYLEKHLDRPVHVESRTGAVAGHEAIAAAAPDGLTLGMITGEIGMMHWHPGITALTPDSYTALAVPYVEASAVIVRADAPWANLGELLDAFRAGTLRGAGSPDFGVWKFSLLGLMRAAGIARDRLAWTPTISGEEGIARLLAGEVDVAPVPMVEAPELIFAGKIRPLATMDGKRHPLFPAIPTVSEAVGLVWEVAHWRGLVAPAGLAPEVREVFVNALRAIAADPGFSAECRDNGYTLGWRFGDDFTAYMHEDDQQFGHVIRPDDLA